jgi:tetratricopeptide (TPR) repeat protein
MRRHALVLVLCFVANPLWAAARKPPVVVAAPDAAKEARKAFEAGQKAFRLGKFAEAISAFETAYRTKPHPIIRVSIAKCAEQLDDLPRALRSYRTYLFELPDTADRGVVEKAITKLEHKLASRNVQQLMVLAEPADAKVSVDGRALGAPPAFIELGPGEHRLLVEREGLATESRSFVMPPQRSLELSVVLQPAKAAVPVAAAVTPLTTPSPPPTSPLVAVTTDPATQGAPVRAGPVVVMAAGAVAAAGGGVLLGLGLAARSATLASLAGSNDTPPTYSTARGQLASANTSMLVGGVVGGVGVLALATGIGWLALGKSPQPSALVSVGPGGLVVQGSF